MLDKATEFMAGTKDPSHGMDHINDLLRDTKNFFESTRNNFDINREVLLLALYWHDVWKSQRKPSKGIFLFHQFYEGLGSMFMFIKYARVVGLAPEVVRPVSYAIRKHSAIQGLPARTLEAQLLWDIDTLDIWNSQRFELLFKNLGWAKISLFDSYVLYMKKVGLHLNFEWTRNEVEKRKPLFFDQMSKFRERLVRGNSKANMFK